jgi:hypothetical protein
MHLTLPIADNAPPPPPTQPTEPPVLDDVLDAYHDGLLSLTGMDDVYHTTGGAGGVAGGASASQLGKRPRAAVEPPAFALTVGDDADLMSLYERLGLHVPSSRDFDFSGVVGEPPLLTASGAPLLPTTIDRPFENAEENRLTIPIGFGPDPARLVPVNDRQYARIVKRRVQRASRLAALAVATGTADTSTTAASASLEAGRKKRAHDAARDKVGRFTDNFN